MRHVLNEPKFIVVMAPAFCCCNCGQPLKPGQCGLQTTTDGPDGLPYQFVFVVCGKHCQAIGLKHLAHGGKVVSLLSAQEFRRLLDEDQLHRVAGFAQFTLWNGIAVLEPYQSNTRDN